MYCCCCNQKTLLLLWSALLLVVGRLIVVKPHAGEIVCNQTSGKCRVCNCVRLRVYDPCNPPMAATGSWATWGGCGEACGGKGISLTMYEVTVPKTGCKQGNEPVDVNTWAQGVDLPTMAGKTIGRRQLLSQADQGDAPPQHLATEDDSD